MGDGGGGRGKRGREILKPKLSNDWNCVMIREEPSYRIYSNKRRPGISAASPMRRQ